MVNGVKTNLKRLRSEKKLTQVELAQKLGVVRQTVSSWETGKTTPDVETLTIIAEALDVDITELIYGTKSVASSTATHKKMLKAAVCLFLISCSFYLLSVVWSPLLTAIGVADTYSADFHYHSPQHLLHVFGGVTFLPLFYIFLGATFAELIKMWKDLSSFPRYIRWLLMFCGLLLLFVLLAEILFFTLPIFSSNSLYFKFLWLYSHPQVFLFSGLFSGFTSTLCEGT